MAEIPEIADPGEMDEQTVARLEELEALLRDSEKLRRWQMLISGGTILLMLLVLTVAIVGMIDYFRSYPQEQLMREIVRQNRRFLGGDPYRYGVDPGKDRELVRYFQAELKREMKTRRPILRQTVRSGVHSLHDFSETELRTFFRSRLFVQLTANAEQFAAEKNYHLDPRKIRLLRKLSATLASEITDRMFDRSTGSRRENLRLFQQEIEELRRSSIYRELGQEPLEMVEERMLENFLECLVCRLNENKAFGRKENLDERIFAK